MSSIMEFNEQTSAIGEPSFADALTWIANDDALDPKTKSHWVTSLRPVAAFLDKPMEIIPARLTNVRQPINRLNAATLGIAPKTLSNHKSNVRAALNHLSGNGRTLARGAPIAADWEVLIDALSHNHYRIALYPLVRYCSAFGISPGEVDQNVIDAYFEHRSTTTLFKVTLHLRRALARAWNNARETVGGWPDVALSEESLPPPSTGPKWEDFHPKLRKQIEDYLETQKGMRRSPTGKRMRPCKSSTIALQRRQFRAYLRKAVGCGFDIGGFQSFKDVLDPEVVKAVLESYWSNVDGAPSVFAIDLASRLRSIAHQTNCLADSDLQELDDVRTLMEGYRPKDLTGKNKDVVRWAIAGDNWPKVVRMPNVLMSEAYAKRGHKDVRAAARAGIAVAIRILTFAPVRVANLASIRLDENLVRPGGPGKPYTLVFTEHDTKNRVPLGFPLDEATTALIDEYVHEYRPALLRGHNADWLFPSDRAGHKNQQTLGDQIKKLTERLVGFPITAHQFRHCAAAIILKAEPGNYEMVRRVLGHKSINTTNNFYVGLETAQATEIFGNMVNQLILERLGEGGSEEAA